MATLKNIVLAAASMALLAGNSGVDAVEVLMSNQNKIATAQNKKKTAELHKKVHKAASQHQESKKTATLSKEGATPLICDPIQTELCRAKNANPAEPINVATQTALLEAAGCTVKSCSTGCCR
ncbi:unnamed protein product [Amoebophrya sp. A120]|nr:unnamed protein product [Amoebophrya sp. A120]|eukprot:GSA120T00013587001.1